MTRAVTVFLASMLLSALGGAAFAGRTICELEPPGASIAEPPPAPPPLHERACIPGVTDDVSCWPDSPLAPLPTVATLAASDASITTPIAPLYDPSTSLFVFACHAARALTPGHDRRVERPPRPFV